MMQQQFQMGRMDAGVYKQPVDALSGLVAHVMCLLTGAECHLVPVQWCSVLRVHGMCILAVSKQAAVIYMTYLL
jgi:hypothetical protein